MKLPTPSKFSRAADHVIPQVKTSSPVSIRGYKRRERGAGLPRHIPRVVSKKQNRVALHINILRTFSASSIPLSGRQEVLQISFPRLGDVTLS
ncbi:hypothetical protein AVEN_248675-1 [Araneus ventricosus]|uniref:Uncharacterized protein n=1 Tax=Araneus ventricosus TaxID=182803 RepID=A0A4Y2C347_ARAVE|nr:hypothetical protein AVEN_248675-1 [Araneus ventricosus]